MSVRIDDPDTSRPTRGGGARSALLVVAGLVVVGLLVWSFVPAGGGGGDEPADELSRTRGEVPTGALAQGTASADLDGATRQVSGVPRGFPQTVDGAVQSYVASLGTFAAGMAGLTAGELETFVRDFTGTTTDYSTIAADKRALLGLDDQGRVIDGQAGDAVVSACPPDLGAYRTSDVVPADGAPTSVTVSYWGPCVYGIGSTTNRERLNVVWQETTATMTWSDGDWRLATGAQPPQDKAPAPADLNRPNTTFAQRSALLGEGWSLFQGASQDWPSEILGEEP
ncbi:hypothetical protein [Solicola sp. PLA-1-18]|uniref:hypothetical protein n=1 Tax=Solicola sp. PLA-1-18 TaxID=3380532 RepID=UPI003B778A03